MTLPRTIATWYGPQGRLSGHSQAGIKLRSYRVDKSAPPDLQVVEGFQDGITQIAYSSWGYLVDMFPPLSIGAGPFVFRDFEHWKAFRDSPLFKELVEELESTTGLKVLGLAYYGQRHVTTRQPLTDPDSLKGLVIRVPSIPTLLLTFRALGAKPVRDTIQRNLSGAHGRDRGGPGESFTGY